MKRITKMTLILLVALLLFPIAATTYLMEYLKQGVDKIYDWLHDQLGKEIDKQTN